MSFSAAVSDEIASALLQDKSGRLRTEDSMRSGSNAPLTAGSLRRMFTLAATLAVAVFALAGAIENISGQDLTTELRAALCLEKKNGLQNFEAKAPELRSQLIAWRRFEQRTLTLVNNSAQEIDKRLAEAVRVVEYYKKRTNDAAQGPESLAEAREGLALWRDCMDLLTKLRSSMDFRRLTPDDITSSPLYTTLENKIKSIESEQVRVANQISILRSALESLRCGEIAETKPTAEPRVDVPLWDLVETKIDTQRLRGQSIGGYNVVKEMGKNKALIVNSVFDSTLTVEAGSPPDVITGDFTVRITVSCSTGKGEYCCIEAGVSPGPLKMEPSGRVGNCGKQVGTTMVYNLHPPGPEIKEFTIVVFVGAVGSMAEYHYKLREL